MFSEFKSPARAGPMRVSSMMPASWPAGLPGINKVGPASNPRCRGSFLARKRMLTSRVKGEENNCGLQHVPIVTGSPRRSGSTSPLAPALLRSRLQRGSYLKASDKDQEHDLDVPTKLLLIRLRRCLCVELAHHFNKTEDTRLRGTSCRAARSHCVMRIWLC